MAKDDYYQTLGVSKSAGEADLKSAYRKLAMKYHPDRNPGDKDAEARFKEVSEAYEVLKDPQKRAAYDQFGHQAFENGGGGGQAGGFDFTSFSDVFDDLFGDFVGGGRGGRSGKTRGSDLRFNLSISLEEAFSGKKTQIKVPSSIQCDACNGSGSEGGSEPTACNTCRGAGRVRTQQGLFTVERTCPTCQGSGRVVTNPCKQCSGAGRVHREKTLAVSVPAGVEDGTRIRLSGEGEAGVRGGPPGDLYIFISVAPHRIFQRDGNNIYCRVPVTMTTAALGGQIEVPTIEGKRGKITVQAGTQSASQIRLRGKGMTELHGNARGDMFVEIAVETPVHLTKKQQELLREFERESGGSEKHNPQSEGFFSRMRDIWDDIREG